MKTRTDRLNNKVSHDEYYAQFVTDSVINRVVDSIGIKAILASTDEHFNNIKLQRWDRTGVIDHTVSLLLKEAGEGVSLATNVCIAKQAAQQIKKAKGEK